MERETGFEPATSSLGIYPSIESKPLARFCCEILNLQRLAESVSSSSVESNEAQMRHLFRPRPQEFGKRIMIKLDTKIKAGLPGNEAAKCRPITMVNQLKITLG